MELRFSQWKSSLAALLYTNTAIRKINHLFNNYDSYIVIELFFYIYYGERRSEFQISLLVCVFFAGEQASCETGGEIALVLYKSKLCTACIETKPHKQG